MQATEVNLDRDAVEAAYTRWAPIYDLVFDWVMDAGRRAIAAAASEVGPNILDVGVGTGLELQYFNRDTQVTGVDLCQPMLRRAQQRAANGALPQLRGLCMMDASRLGFRDGTFDAVIAPYLITVVPNPEETLDEFARVVRDGGEIILVNHIGSEGGWRALIERWLARYANRIGWRTEFPFGRLAGWGASRKGIEMLERRNLPPLGLFTLVRFRKTGSSAHPAPRN
jgi:phosphatidylethanolamine/phosphatidyl-N-methylethanolamine N-methyltransferase